MKNYNLPELILEKSFYSIIGLMEKFSSYNNAGVRIEELDLLEEGTVGKEIATCLKATNIDFVPHFESHDLKHILLDFKMTPLDEIRIQAFMLGNGNQGIPSLLILLYGLILLPTKWNCFWKDYQAGKKAVPIKDWSIENYAEKPLEELRNYVFKGCIYNTNVVPKWERRELSLLGSYMAIFAGIFGMFFCFSSLWSSYIADLPSVGFPFVAGALLVIGGLINLSILSKTLATDPSS